MSQFLVDESRFGSLENKVVVLTGGASGIGRALVNLLHSAGAHVYFGDVVASAGETLAASLGAGVHFYTCDTTCHKDVYDLFRAAYDAHGRVDHAIACAGILERGDFFSHALTIENLRNAAEDEDARKAAGVLHVNLGGTALFARIAIVFLRDDSSASNRETDKSLTLVASVASIRDSPGMYMYQASKHGILGLMRAMRQTIHARDGIRVNAICPGMTESAMTTAIIGTFREKGLSTQTGEDVAKVILTLQTEAKSNGKSYYVEGGSAWEFEDGIWREMERWLGDVPAGMLKANAQFVNEGGLSAAMGR